MNNDCNKERQEKAFEIILIMVGVCATIFCIAYFTDIFKSFLPNHTLTLPKSTNENTNIIDALTLEVNAINNILTWGSFIVAALTIAAAVFGIIGVTAFKEETRTRLDNFKDTINNYSDKVERIENIGNQIENIKGSLFQQERYIDNTTNYLFQATYTIIENMSDTTQAQQLLENLFHELQIAKLYRSSLDADNDSEIYIHKIAAFAYLEENGTMADIPHLEYIVDYDPNKNNKRRAIEVIAIIRNRNNN